MPYVTVEWENSAAIRICYEDHASGPRVVLVRGFGLNGHSRESRRRPCWPPGTGSSPTTAAASARQAGPSIGYDFDTIAGDLHVLLSTLDLHGGGASRVRHGHR
jgi:non-heme chloroperoxidase